MRLCVPKRAILVVLTWWVLLLSRVASAAPPGSSGSSGSSGTRDVAPTIEAGRESDVLVLFLPITLGGQVSPGWTLENVSIEARKITCVVKGPGEANAVVELVHPMNGTGQRASASFVMTGEPAPDSALPGAESVTALMDAIDRNDRGEFWRQWLPPPAAGTEKASWYPRWLENVPSLLSDGILQLCGLALLVGLLLWRDTIGAPFWIRPGLAGVLALSAVLRVVIPDHAALDVWPYARILPLARSAFHGPILSWWSAVSGRVVYLTDVSFAINTIVGILTPLAMYTHARPLLRDHRVALVAAAILAVVPSHIRFSDTDTAFIPALALSSLTFGLVHRAARDVSRFWRAMALLALPGLMLSMLDVRPLNILFLPLYFVQLFALDDRQAPRTRRMIVAALVALLGTGFFFLGFLAKNQHSMPADVNAGLPFRAFVSLFVPRWNTLIHPTVTPPGLTLLAALGGVWLWRQGESRKAAFLVCWMALFFAGHAVVQPSTVEMQSRYQIHLVVPLAMLAAVGLEALASRSERARIVAGVYIAASPLIHLRYIRDVAFNDVREFAFVEQLRERIPAGCTVLEFIGPPRGDDESRFGRIGSSIRNGVVENRFVVQPIGSEDPRRPIRPEAQAILDSPPACLYVYEGIPCQSEKEPSESMAPACSILLQALPMTTVASVRFPSREYDGRLTRGFSPSLTTVELSLYAVTSEHR